MAKIMAFISDFMFIARLDSVAANLGFEVMHERNAHNFPLDLAAAETTAVALKAPTLG